jgi:transcriptional regulator with XRE-family HTH domain
LKRSPSVIDKHVGVRLRERRGILGVTQQQLGVAIGVSFQQVQKYEKGLNRIGAGRLRDVSRVLGVSPAYFFEGSPSEPAPETGFFDVRAIAPSPDGVSVAEGLHLQRSFSKIKNPRVRRRILELVSALAGAEEA